MTRVVTCAMAAMLGLSLAGCMHAVIVSQASADMDRARVGPDVLDAAKLAPQEVAHAEEERGLAREATAHGDPAGADLHAERARVSYERAVTLARLARATDAEAAARTAVAKAEEHASRLAAARVTFEKEASALSVQIEAAREALAPSRVGPADPAREKARALAATSLLAEGELLCGAAVLVAHGAAAPVASTDPSVPGVPEAPLARFLGTVASGKPTGSHPTIDEAAHRRATCLELLTRARRSAGASSSGETDALLAALSAHGGWDPSRDERGVVVTLRGTWKGEALAPEAEQQLRELGRVAASHASFPIEVVVHDATEPREAEQRVDAARAEAALTALVAGGASRREALAESVGARLPVTDPRDPKGRARNARLEIVFVSRSE